VLVHRFVVKFLNVLLFVVLVLIDMHIALDLLVVDTSVSYVSGLLM